MMRPLMLVLLVATAAFAETPQQLAWRCAASKADCATIFAKPTLGELERHLMQLQQDHQRAHDTPTSDPERARLLAKAQAEELRLRDVKPPPDSELLKFCREMQQACRW